MLEAEARPLATARRLFAELAQTTVDPPGVSRDSFGAGEGLAHGLIRREAERLGLDVRCDDIGNLYVTLPGTDRVARALMTGSHIDSVKHGGNFDGAAGVIAGLALLEWLVVRGIEPPFDIVLMVIRAEEMVWFPLHYLGSRAAFGLLPPESVDRVQRSDTGRSLADHMSEQGFDPEAIRQARPSLSPDGIRAFIELHIEQGPVLRGCGKPVGIVSAIRGNVRYRFARITGETTHAGGVPRGFRKDAVMAGAELVGTLEGWWRDYEAAGRDLVVTVGEFATDAAVHGITKVPGAVAFTLDFRSTDPALRAEFDERLQTLAAEIGERRGVRIELGDAVRAEQAVMDAGLVAGLHAAAAKVGVEAMDMASGGGHDCAVFAWQGVPSAMIFVANDHGSHNPDEHMAMADFDQAWRVLATFVDGMIGDV